MQEKNPTSNRHRAQRGPEPVQQVRRGGELYTAVIGTKFGKNGERKGGRQKGLKKNR